MGKKFSQKYKEWLARNKDTEEWDDHIVKSFREFVSNNTKFINEPIEPKKTLLETILTGIRFKTCDQQLELIQFMIDQGAEVSDRTPILIWYVRSATRTSKGPDQTDCVLRVMNLLIENGADIHAKDKYNRTAIDEAIKNDNYEVVKYLIEEEGVDARNKLKDACYSGSVEMVKLLIENGADIHHDPDIYPVLLYALVSEKDAEAKVRALLPYTDLKTLQSVNKKMDKMPMFSDQELVNLVRLIKDDLRKTELLQILLLSTWF